MNQNSQAGENGRIATYSDPTDISPYINGEKKKVVLFAMTSCPYCHMFEERFLEFSRTCSADYDFLRVTIDDPGNPLWSRYEIHVVPQVIVFAKGRIVSRLDSIPFVGITKKNWAEFCAALK
ncbi:MAG: thioredoxin family protein [Candidatus Aminicenantes bacterium]|nr:thioredoxin family protein [Candidatus Aminicenantes bacterium]